MLKIETQGTTPEISPLDLAKLIVNCCSEAKGQDIALLDVQTVFDLSSYFIVVSGRSDRQVQGISNRVLLTLAELGIEPISRDGFDEGHWILMDYGEVVLHIFYEPLRSHYDLENLWRKGSRLPVEASTQNKQSPRAA